jgi:biotin carboxyl carrier protein
MRYRVTVDGRQHTLDIERDEQHGWRASVDGTPQAVDRALVSPGHYSLLLGVRSFEVFVRALPAESADTLPFEVYLDGAPLAVEVVDERLHALAGLGKGRGESGEATVKAPMPGLVASVLVAPGDTVTRNQRVVVLEAMKMQNDLLAPRAGVVRAVKTAQGQAVNQGQPLVVIGDPEGQPPPNEEEDES